MSDLSNMPDLAAMPSMIGDTQGMAAQLLSQLDHSDPMVAMVMKMMEARQMPEPAADQRDDPRLAELEQQLAQTEQRLAAVTREAQQLLSAQRRAVGRLSDLAAALGACGLCWGDDDECPSCRGRGHVGMIRPDLDTRARLLGPSRRTNLSAEHHANTGLQ